MRLGSETRLNVETISTGALSLDMALGIGGLPKGRIIEIYGPESSGKTTVALHCVAEAQKNGGIVAFIDAEHALDPIYAANLGVNVDDLMVAQPDTGEQGLEIEGEMGDSHVGLHARLMSQALRKLAGVISKSNTVAIFINQLREKVGITYGNPEVTTGGRALKFYASVRMEIRKQEFIKKGTEAIGVRTKAKVVKNKMAPPFREAEFDIMYGEGISKTGCVLDVAADLGILKKSGTWYNYGDVRLGQGRENSKNYLKEHPDMLAELDHKVREALLAHPAEEQPHKALQQEKEDENTNL